MQTEVLEPSPENIKRAAEALCADDIVGMPTETVYGLAGNAFSTDAVAKIFLAKECPTFDPVIVHIEQKPSSEPSFIRHIEAQELIPSGIFSSVPSEKIETLCKNFWPGPLTLVLPKTDRVPDLVTSGLQTVAIRMPLHPVAQALIKKTGFPLAAPSANRFGRISPTTAQAVLKELDGRISMILEGGPCSVGLESTVLRIDPSGTVHLLRPGGIAIEKIEAIFGSAIARATTPSSSSAQPSPGMLASHYAPIKPFKILPCSLDRLTPDQTQTLSKEIAPHPGEVGLLLFSPNSDPAIASLASKLGRKITTMSLCPSQKPEEAAKNLFQMMRKLDESIATVLISEPCPWSEGLGYAIADRLTRANSKA